MREAAFVKQNKDKWTTFESVLAKKTEIDPNKLSDLYIEITDHLSYAKTFYPGSNTAFFLNSLASEAHQKIYKTKKEPKNRIISFWKTEFPTLFYHNRRELLIAFLVFSFFCAVGAFSAANDGDFVRSFLGDGYVNMTLENIANDDPMAVYKQQSEFKMFLGITINNIKVAMMAFIYGILLGIGSLFVMMQNGIMLGSFQYMFYEKGLLWESARTIWIHGTIEISVIIIAGCAGLVLAKGILFPGTYTRLESFKRGTVNGLKIMLSTVPFFVVAGFLEGFVTRHTEMPDWLAILIITSSLALILYYYVIYPYLLHKRTNHAE
ncbi:MAG: stage II sporulation protein M [Cellulophaga sp.]|uniref:stage II sporulation protein M n=1 Tax=unclassified Cellulophaga TaxID=2634405 RepID=UPI0026E1A3E2|nr:MULTISPECIES: stage II sporulation protein M [unclassified Cellulophaga]MDO6492072.1 stage II sporulation protein M [Cellulophaga sp. 2_MG-2023]MDO6495767.1 stage II sporulation protein M [Cellulophaga sp. 3_MG-2023]